MSKFIKHEFRATARMMLPLLLIFVASAFLEALISCTTRVPRFINTLISLTFAASIIAIIIVGLIIIISRFYKNTMTDSAYLTMTLPITEHEFICGELITNVIWLLITLAVMFATAVLTANITGYANVFNFHLGGYLGQFNGQMLGNGISWFDMAAIYIQLALSIVLAFTAFCMHIYCSMAIGQLFNKYRILMSVIAFIVIRIVLMSVFSGLTDFGGMNMHLSFNTLAMAVNGSNFVISLMNLMMAVEAAILYVPTFLLIGKKLNLV